MSENNQHGALTEAVFYILLSLYKPLHGYAIMQNIIKLSNGRVILGAGTLYGALGTLVKRGWINGLSFIPDTRKKEYIITDSGKKAVLNELKRLAELYENGRNTIINYSNEANISN